MGLSIAITGTIILFTLMAVMFTLSTMVNSLVTMEDVSSQASVIKDSISQTSIQIMSANAKSGNDYVLVSLANNGTGKLWDYDKFTLLVTYDANIGGTKTKVTEEFSYSGINSFKTTTVYLVPDGEASGGWSAQTGCGAITPWECVDEAPPSTAPDNTNYIITANLNQNDQEQVEFSLTDTAVPPIVSDVIIHYTYGEEAQSAISDPDLMVSLYEGGTGGTQIWTETQLGQLPNPAPGTFGQQDAALSNAEIDLIGNYNDLSLEFVAICVDTVTCEGGGGSNEKVYVSWGIVEVSGPLTGSDTEWVVYQIQNDVLDPRIVNKGETADIAVNLSNQIFAGGDLIISISTDNGVTATTAILAS